jgi:alpha-1,3-mannosyl-glycoprotein beta-1,2-N-acetylglucosaminyltransferase
LRGGREYGPGDFPVAVVAFARAHYLRRCLASLLAVEGLDRGKVTVYQDGFDEGVAQVARELALALVQHTRQAQGDGAAHIAKHYGSMLAHAFAANPHAPYIVVVEEDLVFAPDLLHYFARMAQVMDADPTVLAVSAYNDNGLAPIASNTCQVYPTPARCTGASGSRD